MITGETLGWPSGTTSLANDGENVTAVEGYSLIGESPQLPTGEQGAGLPTIDLRYAGVQTIPLEAGPTCFDEESFLLLLAVNTWERQTHANAPASFEWQIDTNEDGEADYAVFNFEAAGDLSDGRNVVFVDEIEGDNDSARFFTDHATNSANTTLTICAQQIGLTADDVFTPLTADLLAIDLYFTGGVTDEILGMEFSPLGERFFPVIDGGFGAGVVPAESSVELTALDFGVDGTNPGETGMLLFTDGTLFNGEELHKSGSPQANEAIAVRVTDDLPFDDIAGTKFVDDIVWAFENGITTGCGGGKYCPNEAVTRAQMATFLNRALGLPGTSEDFFIDDETSSHERAINRLAAAGITTGCGGGKYCPNEAVTRAQMATFLNRALGLPGTAEDFFTDDETSSSPSGPSTASRRRASRPDARQRGSARTRSSPADRWPRSCIGPSRSSPEAGRSTPTLTTGPPSRGPVQVTRKSGLRGLPVRVAGEQAVDEPDLVGEVEAERQWQEPGADHQPTVDPGPIERWLPRRDPDDCREDGHPDGHTGAEDHQVQQRRPGVLDRGENEKRDGRRSCEAVNQPTATGRISLYRPDVSTMLEGGMTRARGGGHVGVHAPLQPRGRGGVRGDGRASVPAA